MSKKKDVGALVVGATTGIATRAVIGKAGVAVAGTAFSVGTLPIILTGAAIASTVYTIFKLFRD